MSSMEFHYGRMREIEVDGDTLEEQVKTLERDGHSVEYWDDDEAYGVVDCEGIFYDSDTKQFYNMIEHTEGDPSIYRDKEGVIHFSTSFYNGGCGFDEALSSLLQGL